MLQPKLTSNRLSDEDDCSAASPPAQVCLTGLLLFSCTTLKRVFLGNVRWSIRLGARI